MPLPYLTGVNPRLKFAKGQKAYEKIWRQKLKLQKKCSKVLSGRRRKHVLWDQTNENLGGWRKVEVRIETSDTGNILGHADRSRNYALLVVSDSFYGTCVWCIGEYFPLAFTRFLVHTLRQLRSRQLLEAFGMRGHPEVQVKSIVPHCHSLLEERRE